MKTATLKIDVAPGEVIDKITILEIKRRRIADPAKLANVERELALLSQALAAAVPSSARLVALRGELAAINEAIWEVEDGIRDQERRGDFGAEFIRLARAVYHNNDRRAEIKRAINDLLGSELVEEKSYTPY